MLSKFFTTFTLSIALLLSSHVAFAQSNIDINDPSSLICQPGPTMASNKCTLGNGGNYIYNLFMYVLVILLLLISPIRLAVALTFDWLKSMGGAPFRESVKKRWADIVIALILLALAFSLKSIASELNINKEFLRFNIFSLLPVEHAYADVGPEAFIPGGPVDILLLFVQVLWKWFFFPVVILAWLYAGFLYVGAQGNAEKIKEAHTKLITVLILTALLLFVQGFLYAFKATSVPQKKVSMFRQQEKVLAITRSELTL